mmetsp:Transcript_87621/g.234586  ORF Transcript_87621/g.234586 Transcript_87621/m.234586 type:complete len:169 (+) Transcript_87621:234-740(+)
MGRATWRAAALSEVTSPAPPTTSASAPRACAWTPPGCASPRAARRRRRPGADPTPEPDTCGRQTGGTCFNQQCYAGRGAARCVVGLCWCQTGTCADEDGVCRPYFPKVPTRKTSRLCSDVDPCFSYSSAVCVFPAGITWFGTCECKPGYIADSVDVCHPAPGVVVADD